MLSVALYGSVLAFGPGVAAAKVGTAPIGAKLGAFAAPKTSCGAALAEAELEVFPNGTCHDGGGATFGTSCGGFCLFAGDIPGPKPAESIL